MPPSADPAGRARRRAADGAVAVLWGVAAATPLVAPLVGFGAIALLVAVGLAEPAGRATAWRALRAWPSAWWWGVALLAGVHAARGAVWTDLAAAAAWCVVLAVAARPTSAGPRAAGLRWGLLAAVAVQATLVVPELGLDRAVGAAAHPNLLAAGLALAAATALVVPPGRTPHVRVVGYGVAAAAFALALATGSRGMWLGATLGVLAWALTDRGPGRGAWRAAVIAAVAVGGLAVAGVRGFDLATLLTSDVERGVVQGVALSLAAERPLLGHGGAPWSELAVRVEPSVPAALFAHAHSVPLHVAARGGALALALVALVLARAVPVGVRALRRLGRAAPAAALGAYGAAGVVLAQSLVDLVLPHPTVYVAAWVLGAALIDRVRVVSCADVDVGGRS